MELQRIRERREIAETRKKVNEGEREGGFAEMQRSEREGEIRLRKERVEKEYCRKRKGYKKRPLYTGAVNVDAPKTKNPQRNPPWNFFFFQ